MEMTCQSLENLSRESCEKIDAYLWKRLRREVFDPPLDDRYGPEPPTRFVLAAVRASGDPEFRIRVVSSLGRLLQRLSQDYSSKGRTLADIWGSNPDDALVGGVCNLAVELGAVELWGQLTTFENAALTTHTGAPLDFAAIERSWGAAHFLRALAHLQRGDDLASRWRKLAASAPPRLLPLVFFGWVRSDKTAALAKIARLVEAASEIDLPSAIWALTEPGGATEAELAAAARDARVFEEVREAFTDAGGNARVFDQSEYENVETGSDEDFASHSEFLKSVSASWASVARGGARGSGHAAWAKRREVLADVHNVFGHAGCSGGASDSETCADRSYAVARGFVIRNDRGSPFTFFGIPSAELKNTDTQVLGDRFENAVREYRRRATSINQESNIA